MVMARQERGDRERTVVLGSVQAMFGVSFGKVGGAGQSGANRTSPAALVNMYIRIYVSRKNMYVRISPINGTVDTAECSGICICI
jgi:hypothetical protein